MKTWGKSNAAKIGTNWTMFKLTTPRYTVGDGNHLSWIQPACTQCKYMQAHLNIINTVIIPSYQLKINYSDNISAELKVATNYYETEVQQKSW